MRSSVTSSPIVRRDIGVGTAQSPDTEQMADALLAAHGALGRHQGIYTGVQLNRKMRTEQERLPRFDLCGLPAEIINELGERQIDDLIEVSDLSAIQEIVARLYIGGFSWKSITAALGLDRRLIKRHLRIAVRKLRAAYEEGAYAGWYEVYLSEVNRTAYAHKTI